MSVRVRLNTETDIVNRNFDNLFEAKQFIKGFPGYIGYSLWINGNLAEIR
jgi:hypothetical protein